MLKGQVDRKEAVLEGFILDTAKKEHTPKGSLTQHPRTWKGVSPKDLPIPYREVDLTRPVIIKNKSGRFEKRKLTSKQQMYAKFRMEGYSKRQSRLRAGYTTGNSTNIYNAANAVDTFLATVGDQLKRAGLDDDKMVAKFKEWIDAKKRIVSKSGEVYEDSNYDIQLKAFDRWKEFVHPIIKTGSEGMSKKREVTLTEWVEEG